MNSASSNVPLHKLSSEKTVVPMAAQVPRSVGQRVPGRIRDVGCAVAADCVCAFVSIERSTSDIRVGIMGDICVGIMGNGYAMVVCE